MRRGWGLLAAVAACAVAIVAATVGSASARTAAAGAAAPCTPVKLGVVFVIDDSGSNTETDPDDLRAEAVKVAMSFLPDGTVLSAVRFADRGIGIFSNETLRTAIRNDLNDAIVHSMYSDGGTNYDAAFQRANSELASMSPVGQRIVIFLSDGQPNGDFTADSVIAGQGVPIYTVGYGSSSSAILDGIATRSKAPHAAYMIQDAAQAANAFTSITAPYRCDVQLANTSTTVPAGQTKSIRFFVPPGAPGFDALVTWDEGDPKLVLQPPSGKNITASTTVGTNASRFEVSAPVNGIWKLFATAAADTNVQLHFTLWKTPPGPSVAAGWAKGGKPSDRASQWAADKTYGSTQAECGPNAIALYRLRGSGENPPKTPIGNDRLGQWADAAGTALIADGWRVRDLQSSYPAPDTPIVAVAIALFDGNPIAVANAVRALKKYRDVAEASWPDDLTNIVRIYQHCPQRKILIAGYSQGNIVLRYVIPHLPEKVRNQIVAIDLVADPTAQGSVDASMHHSGPHGLRRTDEGIDTAGARGLGVRRSFKQTAYPSDIVKRVFQYCVPYDLVCDANPVNVRGLVAKVHSSYDFKSIGKDAADYANDHRSW